MINDNPGSTFREVRRIMQEPDEIEWSAPWTDREFQEFAAQEPLPPNQSFHLQAEEPNESELYESTC